MDVSTVTSDALFFPDRTLTIPVIASEQEFRDLSLALAHTGHELLRLPNIEAFIAEMLKSDCPIAIADVDYMGEQYRLLQDYLRGLDDPPNVIALATDGSKWASLLLSGAYDLQTKPINGIQCAKSVNTGWVRWETLRRRRIAIEEYIAALEPDSSPPEETVDYYSAVEELDY